MTRPNVLLIVMDSVRARNTSLHGHEHDTTPFLEGFADAATTYTQARAPGNWSLTSHASMFTGLHVVEHGVRRLADRLEPGHTVWEELAGEGYATGVFSENVWITEMDVGLKDAFGTVEASQNFPYPEAADPNVPYHRFASKRGLEQYVALARESLDADRTLKALANGIVTKLAWDHPALLPEGWSATATPAETYTDLFLEWSRDQSGPWAACVNYMDAHFPYHPPAEHDRWGGSRLRDLQADMDDQVWEFPGGARPWWQRRALEALYDGSIRYIDAEIERLVSALEARGELAETLVVVTGDHGEGFGEPSRLRPGTRIAGHDAGVHERLLHVPLVVRYPGQSAARTVEDVATLTAFPDAVRAALEGDRTEFVPEGPVYASSHGLEEPMEERALGYVDDVWRFNGDALVVYEDVPGGARKYARWRDDYDLELTVPSAREAYVSGTDGGERVAEAFADLEPRGVTERADGEIRKPTRERLADLGYI